jgi:hypothetical protein
MSRDLESKTRKQVPAMRSHDNTPSIPSLPRRFAAALPAALGLLMAFASPTAGVSPASAATAVGARAVFLNENGDLRLTSRHGFTLNEQGHATGTVTGPIYVHLKIVSSSRVTAEVSIYPKSGSITGYGSAGYRRAGATGYFSGSLSIARGTGAYGKARGSGLSFSGTIQRSDYAIAVHVRGEVND